jgi:hypothetical protein
MSQIAAIAMATKPEMAPTFLRRKWRLVAHRRRVLIAANKAAYSGTSAIAVGRHVIADGSAPRLTARDAIVGTKRSA